MRRKTKEIKPKEPKESKLKWILGILVILLCAALTGAGIKLNIDYNNLTATIEYSEPKEVLLEEEEELELEEGTEIPTVESVESNMQVLEPSEECPEGEECGMGAFVPTLNVSSPQAFAKDTLGRCIDTDNYAGSQCWDLANAFFVNYAGRTLSTCGTGAAKGTIQDGCWQRNAGNDFVMIWDATKIQAGDIAVFSTGTWGHIGMAMGDYNNGYFTLLGQNQGGKSCPGGGSVGTIINISAKDFIGAFRPKKYIKPEPKPTPKPAPTPKNPDSGIVK